MLLQLTDGTTTIDLTSTAPVTGCIYFPQMPRSLRAKSVEETATVRLTGTDSQIRATTNAIERMFEQAIERAEDGVGPRVWVMYRPVPSDSLYRAKVRAGRLSWSDEPMLRRLKETTPTVMVALLWEREPFEGPEVEAAIKSKANGTPGTGGKAVANSSDSSRGNWVEIASTEIIGTLPALTRISMQNTSGSGQDYSNIWIATNVKSDPVNFVHVIEGESKITGGGTVTADSGSSSGNYISYPVSGSTLMAWSLPAATVDDCGGRDFRLLARLVSLPAAPIYVTPIIKEYNNLITLIAGKEMRIDPSGFRLVDLGSLPIPPGGGDASGWAGLTLYLGLRCDTSATLALDYIQLTPTDSLRHLYQRGMTIPNNDYVEDHAIDGLAYSIESGAKHPLHMQLESPVMVWPGVTQRIYFLYDSTFGASPVAATLSVRVYYRPRRWTV